jgi:hypothetical protein
MAVNLYDKNSVGTDLERGMAYQQPYSPPKPSTITPTSVDTVENIDGQNITMHELGLSEIALKDTMTYNTWFQTISALKNEANKAFSAGDTAGGELYTQGMYTVVDKMESDLSSDSVYTSIGNILEQWEIEGKGSFGPFAADMLAQEKLANVDDLYTGKTKIALSSKQRKEALSALKEKEDRYKETKIQTDEFTAARQEYREEQVSIWNRYQALQSIDPDYDFPLETRLVWWGMATPDNEIQKEIAELGDRWRDVNAKDQSLAHRAIHTGLGFPPTAKHAETQYQDALQALEGLGE